MTFKELEELVISWGCDRDFNLELDEDYFKIAKERIEKHEVEE